MNKLLAAVEKMNRDYPRPGLAIGEFGEYCTDLAWSHSAWPNVDLPGIYVFLDENRSVLYIGKTSNFSTLGDRLSHYWCRGTNDETMSKSDKSLGAKYVCTVGVPTERAFEVPSIEEFLIREVNPPRNNHGTSK